MSPTLLLRFSFIGALAALFVTQSAGQSTRETTDREVDKAIAQDIADRFGGDRGKFLDFLREQHKTARDYGREVEERLKATTPDEQIRLRLIRITRQEGEKDEQLVERTNRAIGAKLKVGSSFAELARQHSDDKRSSAGGDWGWIKRSDLKKPFVDTAFALKPGEVSTPIVVPEGCFILFVEDRR